MTTDEIRSKYLEFMRENGHAIIPRANLVPQDDPTTLFTGSGMQPLIPYLLGAEHPGGKRLVDSQTCFRAEDIDEVGDNRHTTYFEMLGNWSLGDYFKREQLTWFFTFLTEIVGLDASKLYVSAFIGNEEYGIPKDSESAEIWQELFKKAGIDAQVAEIGSEADGYKVGMKDGQRIFFYDAAKNWWTRSGLPQTMPAGEPGGPDSEVFYDFGTEHDPEFGEHCHPNCDCGRFLEIGNSVFMQYRKNDAGGFDELPQKNVDFGGGLERIAAAANNDPDVFKIDLIWPLIEKLEELSGKQYHDEALAMRVIADHLRSAIMIATDGVRPSNTAQGYVLRRLLRRAIRQGLRLGIKDNLCETIAAKVIDLYSVTYPEVRANEVEVLEALRKEERTFRQTLERGVREFEKIVGKVMSLKPGGESVHYPKPKISGSELFMMFDTYGFPPELSLEEAQHLKVEVDDNWQQQFDGLMTEQKERSRTATVGTFKGGLADTSEATLKLHTATHLMYQALKDVLGSHVVQRGSNITPERIRFDFSHDAKMTDEEKAKVEAIVNEQINRDLKVWFEEHPTAEAFQLGASGAFGDKYGDTVKVYFMAKEGEKPFSVEICGGPHVEHTGGLGSFKIQKEESSSAGVRRIKAKLV
jgi:alanyl-tRNA synthetase